MTILSRRRLQLSTLMLLALGIYHFYPALAVTPEAEKTTTSTPPAKPGPQEKIVLAGGCFWGMEAVFKHVKGVISATPGYAGGAADTARYERVTQGDTGHAEAVEVVYDPTRVDLSQLLDVYFTVAHNPTHLNRQEMDVGTQYRSAVFYQSPAQKKLVEEKISQLQQQKLFKDPIVTKLESASVFYPAEEYHHNYAALHPYQPYIMLHDAPKVAALEKKFPNLYLADQ